MDTVVTRLTDAWTDLTAVWDAATPPPADGETITIQPGDRGDSHAIVVAQAAAHPTARDGHLVADDIVLHLVVASGRKHYGRAYMGSAVAVATGAGVE